MLGRFDHGFRRNRDRALNAARNMMLLGLLAGCSSVPDAVNPVEWYKGASNLITGKEKTEVAAPVPPKGQFPDVTKTAADTRKDLTKGLPADRGNSKYAEPVRREVTPTKQLTRKAPVVQPETQVAQAPAVPPKPEVVKQELPSNPTVVVQSDASRLSPDQRTAQARNLGPDKPPASVAMTPPAPADIPETVAMPARGKAKPLQEQFQRRLAESAQQTVRPGMVEMPQPVLASARGDEEPIHLIPPGSARKVKGGGKGMAAPQPEPMPAASFQIASVDFRSGSSELTAADRQAIAEVARLYKQTGGVVRVVGHAPTPAFGHADAVDQLMGGLDASMKRANAVARELSKRGVPGGKIMVGADPSVAAMGETGAQVFLDVI